MGETIHGERSQWCALGMRAVVTSTARKARSEETFSLAVTENEELKLQGSLMTIGTYIQRVMTLENIQTL